MYKSGLQVFDDGGMVYGGGDRIQEEADPSKPFITRYNVLESGEVVPYQERNQLYDWAAEDAKFAAFLATPEGQAWKAQDDANQAAHSNHRSGGFFKNMVQDIGHNPVALAALAGITGGAAAEFIPGLLASGAATAPAVEGGLGSVTMANAPAAFTGSGALTDAAGFGSGVTFGGPETLAGAQAALSSAASPSLLDTAARYATPSNLAKVAQTARSLTKKPTGSGQGSGQGGGQGGQSNRSNPYTDPTLDTTESFLTGGGGGANKYDLAQVYHQMSPGDTGGLPVMAASGGSLSDLLKESFSEKNLFPQSKDIDDRPMILTSQNPGIKTDLAKIKRIKHMGMAQGGLPEKYAAAAPHGHRPEFITGITGHYACGKGTGQSDDIPAMLHDGDYVMDAETVSALGDGSSKAGKEVLEGFHKRIKYKSGGQANPVPAKIADGEYVFDAGFVTALGGGDNRRGSEILDGLREKLRAHKRGAPVNKIPPKAKDPAQYIGKGK